MDNLTTGYLLNGRVKFYQPKNGFRVAIDSIFLAAALDVKEGESVLDVGSGVGAASLCLAMRIPHAKVVGLEIQRSYVRIGYDNVQLNNLHSRVEFLCGNLLTPLPRLAAGTFSHVMANPPYYTENHRPSEKNEKADANHEMSTDLKQWVKYSLLMLRPKGTLTFILTADRLDEVIHLLYGKIGKIKLFPLWSGVGKEAKRFVVQGVKGLSGSCHILPGLILHRGSGQYTQEADEVLRHAKGLAL